MSDVQPVHGDPVDDGMVSSARFCALSGVSYRQLDYWTSQGYLDVSKGKANPGSGRERRYSMEQVEIAKSILTLLGAGCTLALALESVRGAKKQASKGKRWWTYINPDGIEVRWPREETS